jgi:uncharacterized protein DUF3105
VASRKEEKERLRAERLAAEGREAAEERRKRMIGLGVAGVLTLAAIAVVAFVIAGSGGGGSGSGNAHIVNVAGATTTARATPDDRVGTKTQPGPLVTNLDEAAKVAKCKVSNPPDEGNNHLGPKDPTPKYKTNPPTSGNHDPVPLADGAYLTMPPPRNLVHTMEHGRVEIQYSSKLPVAEQLKLKGVFDESFQVMVLFPNEEMPYQVAATAWDHALLCKKYNDQVLDAIRAFRDTYRGNGPEPPGTQPA